MSKADHAHAPATAAAAAHLAAGSLLRRGLGGGLCRTLVALLLSTGLACACPDAEGSLPPRSGLAHPAELVVLASARALLLLLAAVTLVAATLLFLLLLVVVVFLLLVLALGALGRIGQLATPRRVRTVRVQGQVRVAVPVDLEVRVAEEPHKTAVVQQVARRRRLRRRLLRALALVPARRRAAQLVGQLGVDFDFGLDDGRDAALGLGGHLLGQRVLAPLLVSEGLRERRSLGMQPRVDEEACNT